MPNPKRDLNPAEVAKLLNAGKSPRTARIETYEKFYDGTIYDGRVDFLDQASDKPLLERAPCVVYPLVRAAVQSNVSLCLGDRRFPQILAQTNEDNSAFDAQFGLNKDDSAVLDAANQRIVDQARLPAVFQQMLESSMSGGTVVAIISIDHGFLKVSQLDAKCCTPTFSPKNPHELEKVEISYRYVEDEWAPELDRWIKIVKQYRRVVDKTTDTTFVPVEITDEKHYPVPSIPDPNLVVEHGFGFVPVHWYKHLVNIAEKQSIDGRPIHWGLTGQLEALDMALSQRHRAALYCGEPMYWETGVDPDDDVAPMGRTAAAPQPTADNPAGRPMPGGWSFGTGRKTVAARKKGPGVVWRYDNPESKVGMLTMPGDALKAIDGHANDLRAKLSEAMGVVFIDPAMLRGTADISGKALAVIYANQLARCNAIREDFGRNLILPVLNLIYRVILRTKKGLYLAGADKIRPILKKFEVEVEGEKTWFSPMLKLSWGDYFEPSDVDEATRIHTGAEAYQAELITLKTFVEHVKSVFAITNTDEYVKELMKEREERHKENLEMAAAGAQAKAAFDGRPPAQAARPAAGDPKAGRALTNRKQGAVKGAGPSSSSSAQTSFTSGNE